MHFLIHGNILDTLSLTGMIYDHEPSRNPDFEWVISVDYGIVENYLSADRRPIFKPVTSATVHSAATFNQVC